MDDEGRAVDDEERAVDDEDARVETEADVPARGLGGEGCAVAVPVSSRMVQQAPLSICERYILAAVSHHFRKVSCRKCEGGLGKLINTLNQSVLTNVDLYGILFHGRAV